MTYFSPARAASLTVTNTDDNGPGSLRQALIDANIAPGADTIRFAVSGTIEIDSPLPLVQGDVTLQGPGADQLTISGEYLHRIFDVRAGSALTISDLALTQGRAPNGEAGGAIRSYGSLMLQHVHLHDNLSVSIGGAVYAEDGALYIADSLIQSNTADSNGGIYINSSTAAITGTVFAQNGGSAIAAYRRSELYITTTQVISNAGRGLEIDRSNVQAADMQIALNAGGGVRTDGGRLTLIDSTISDNRSDQGAGLHAVWSTILITDTILARNAAGRQGGAIYLSISDARFTMSGGTIISNTASSGAGIHVASGYLHLRGTHILHNVGQQGSALYLNSMRDAVVADGCVVDNRTTSSEGAAVELASYNSYYLAAPNNWWGAADGPSGAGAGSGDSIDERVIYANYKTLAPEGCPTIAVVRLYLPAVNR